MNNDLDLCMDFCWEFLRLFLVKWQVNENTFYKNKAGLMWKSYWITVHKIQCFPFQWILCSVWQFVLDTFIFLHEISHSQLSRRWKSVDSGIISKFLHINYFFSHISKLCYIIPRHILILMVTWHAEANLMKFKQHSARSYFWLMGSSHDRCHFVKDSKLKWAQ